MVVGEGFINHQEHNAGEEGQGQDDQNRHLEGGQTLVIVCVPMCVIVVSVWFIYSMLDKVRVETARKMEYVHWCVCVCVCSHTKWYSKMLLTEVDGSSRQGVPVELCDK